MSDTGDATKGDRTGDRTGDRPVEIGPRAERPLAGWPAEAPAAGIDEMIDHLFDGSPAGSLDGLSDRHAVETGDGSTRDGSTGGGADLLARLEHDPEAVARLADRALLHAALRRATRRRRLADWAVAETMAGKPMPSPRMRSAWARPAVVTAAVAAAMAGCLLVAVWPRGATPPGIVRSAAPPSASLPHATLPHATLPHATVTRAIGAAVAAVPPGAVPLTDGAMVNADVHHLEAGLLTLRTSRGVEVVIEAPASFRFESPQRLRMIRGRMTADVPQAAKGFTVVMPSGEAVDLGTRFAVDVLPTGESEVHVFVGEVVTRGGDGQRRSLRDGEAVAVAANVARELRTASFIRGDEVDGLVAAVAAGQEGRAAAARDRLRRDPALVTLVDFTAGNPGHEAGPGVGPSAAGQYRMLQGRWPGSRAADFSAVGDHLPLDVGGGAEWPRLSLAAWVRIDRLGQPYQSLYHTDGWQADTPGQVHWMITQDCVMRLALRQMVLADDAVERHGFPDSRTPVVGARGRWMHLAAVYDSVAGTARFYVDGRRDGETRLAYAPPARLGPARIGNWNRDDRRLSGRIDELVILGRALADEEVAALHADGSPYHDAEGSR